jgi:SNF2 family DNA or RNA helicase
LAFVAINVLVLKIHPALNVLMLAMLCTFITFAQTFPNLLFPYLCFPLWNDGGVLLTSYDSYWLHVYEHGTDWNYVFLDEGHHIKNTETKHDKSL